MRDWIIDEADRVIEQYDVDWILQDGENMVKRCTKTTHTHAPDDSNYSNAVDGLNYVVQEIQRRNPRVHWENCEDGGNMMTFNMVGNYVTSIAADDSGPLTTRQAVYGITYPFSPRYADRYMPEEELGPYGTRSFMFGGPWIFMNRLAEMRPQDLEMAASEIALFKQIRGHIRDGKVFHVTGRPTETGIDAIESYQPETDTAIVFVFCGDSETLQRNVQIRGFDPEKTYRVRYHDEGAPRPRDLHRSATHPGHNGAHARQVEHAPDFCGAGVGGRTAPQKRAKVVGQACPERARRAVQSGFRLPLRLCERPDGRRSAEAPAAATRSVQRPGPAA